MNTRQTSDYSPTRPGSRQENQAINARREMMNGFSNREVKLPSVRKTWTERMLRKAKGFTLN